MDPFSIAMLVMTAVGLVANTVGTGITNAQNKKLTEENREDMQEFNAEQAELANQREVDKYQTLYSPEARVQQLHKAGLSTGLIYGGNGMSGTSTAGAQATAGATNVIPMINPMAGMMEQITSSMKAAKEAEKTTEETNNLMQVNENLKEELKNMAQQRKESEQRINNMAQQLQNSKLQETALQLQNDMLKIERDIADATKEDKAQAIRDGANLLSQSLEKGLHEIEILKIDEATEKEMRQAIIDNYKASMKELGARAALEAQQSVESEVRGWLGIAEMSEISAKIDLMVQEGKLKEAQAAEIYKQIEKYDTEIKLITQELQTEIERTKLVGKQAKYEGAKAIADIVEKYTHAAKNFTSALTDIMNMIPKGGGGTYQFGSGNSNATGSYIY